MPIVTYSFISGKCFILVRVTCGSRAYPVNSGHETGMQPELDTSPGHYPHTHSHTRVDNSLTEMFLGGERKPENHHHKENLQKRPEVFRTFRAPKQQLTWATAPPAFPFSHCLLHK